MLTEYQIGLVFVIVCAICGKRNGLLVGKDEWEAKHPQLEVLRHLPDAEALRNPRPDSRAEPP